MSEQRSGLHEADGMRKIRQDETVRHVADFKHHVDLKRSERVVRHGLAVAVLVAQVPAADPDARCRRQLHTHVTRGAAVHRATRSNQLWSWDITYLPTAVRGRFLRLYLVLDVWSRRIVGWDVHEHEVATHAATLIQRICAESGVDPKGLVLHSDNGKPMRGRTMVTTLQWLGIVPSFSRPHVCNDNPYSEALFRTLKHTPVYPRLPFADREAARRWVARFVSWYNSEHRHSAIRYVTPDERHSGADVAILARRARTLRTRPEPQARAMAPPDSQLDAHRTRGPQPGTDQPRIQDRMTTATTTLTLTAERIGNTFGPNGLSIGSSLHVSSSK
jgi:transposase InsO family protein